MYVVGQLIITGQKDINKWDKKKTCTRMCFDDTHEVLHILFIISVKLFVTFYGSNYSKFTKIWMPAGRIHTLPLKKIMTKFSS